VRTPLILLTILGLAAVVLYHLMPQSARDRRLEDIPTTRPEAIVPVPDADTISDRRNPPRQVAPKQFAPPFAKDAVQLERIAPRQPLTAPPLANSTPQSVNSTPQSVKPTPQSADTAPQSVDTAPKATPLHRPVVTAAGVFSYPMGELRLAGIEVLDPAESCLDADGAAWPCGVIARTAFRNFLRGRPLSCVVPPGPWTEPVVRECLVGRDDPAAWLVRRGWARAAAGSAYAALEDVARQDRAGLHGSDPRGQSPVVDSGVRITPLPGSPPEPPQ